ncbi:hypothetical protein ACDZ28_31490 [Paenibacillus sp. RS8]
MAPGLIAVTIVLENGSEGIGKIYTVGICRRAICQMIEHKVKYEALSARIRCQPVL